MTSIESLRRVWALAAVTVLSACGGGGGGGSAAPAPAPAPTPSGPSAQGLYSGALTGSRSSAFQLLVLENDEFWGVYPGEVVQ